MVNMFNNRSCVEHREFNKAYCKVHIIDYIYSGRIDYSRRFDYSRKIDSFVDLQQDATTLFIQSIFDLYVREFN